MFNDCLGEAGFLSQSQLMSMDQKTEWRAVRKRADNQHRNLTVGIRLATLSPRSAVAIRACLRITYSHSTPTRGDEVGTSAGYLPTLYPNKPRASYTDIANRRVHRIKWTESRQQEAGYEATASLNIDAGNKMHWQMK